MDRTSSIVTIGRNLPRDTRKLKEDLNSFDFKQKSRNILGIIQHFSAIIHQNNSEKRDRVNAYFEDLIDEKDRSFDQLRMNLNAAKVKKFPYLGPFNLSEIGPIILQLHYLITIEIRNLLFLTSVIENKLEPGRKGGLPRLDRKSVFLVGAAHAPDLAKQITMLFGEEKTVSIAKSYQSLVGPPQHEEV